MEGVLKIKKSLTISDVVQILENANEYNYISAPPSKPKASQVFLYKTDDAAKEGNNIFKNTVSTFFYCNKNSIIVYTKIAV